MDTNTYKLKYIMTPSKMLNANTERNSLLVMLAEGRRLVKRRSENRSDAKYTHAYPPMGTHLHRRSVQNWERVRKSSLDTTNHTTSHIHNDDVTRPIVDSVNGHNHDSSNSLFVAKGIFNEKLVNSFKHELYTSIDLSNVTKTEDQVDQNINALFLCVNVSTNCSHLQSLCLHNCQIEDMCVKHVASIITSNRSMLSSLNLSKNEVTDVGAKVLLDAMKSHNCILQELDLSQNQLTLHGIASFAENLYTLLHLRVLRLADPEHLVPLSIYQQFAAAIEKNVTLKTLTLGSEVMDGCKNEYVREHTTEKVDKFDNFLLCFWHEPLHTSITYHLWSMLKQNNSGIGELLSSSRIDVAKLRDALENVKPEKQLDACFRLIRLRPDMLIAVA